MGEERRPTTGQCIPTREMVLAWGDWHSIEMSNGEADDLVRRLHSTAIPFDDAEVVERCVTEALLLMAERFEDNERAAESLRRLAVEVSDTMLALGLVEEARCAHPCDDESPVSDGEREPSAPSGLAGHVEAEDDDAPGISVDESSETPLRYDAIYLKKPVMVTLNRKRAAAIWPPSYGRVRLQLEGSRRSLTVALDELDDRSRWILRDAKVRLRTEAVVRCRVAHCTQCFRGWMRQDGGIGDTKGEPISELGSLFAARCEAHRLTR